MCQHTKDPSHTPLWLRSLGLTLVAVAVAFAGANSVATAAANTSNAIAPGGYSAAPSPPVQATPLPGNAPRVPDGNLPTLSPAADSGLRAIVTASTFAYSQTTGQLAATPTTPVEIDWAMHGDSEITFSAFAQSDESLAIPLAIGGTVDTGSFEPVEFVTDGAPLAAWTRDELLAMSTELGVETPDTSLISARLYEGSMFGNSGVTTDIIVVVTVSADEETGDLELRMLPSVIPSRLRSGSTLRTPGGLTSDRFQLAILPLLGAGALCVLKADACRSDTESAQSACNTNCLNGAVNTNACIDCCLARAAEDLLNCSRTCGLNGPDNDYGHCQTVATW